MKLYAEVIINSDALEIDKPFTYEIPENYIKLVKIGQWVKVPFGYRNSMDAFIIKLIEQEEIKEFEIKEINKIENIEPLLTEDDLKIVNFLKDNYLCKYIDAIRLFIPQGILKGIKNKQKMVISINREKYNADIYEKYKDILSIIEKNDGKFTKSELSKNFSLSLYKINKLIKEEYLKVEEETIYRYNIKEYKTYGEKTLNSEQINAVNVINKSNRKVFLLKGVTGSGKTEVYMNAVSDVLKEGKSAVILVPEISLTPQMIERFKGRFGREVAVFHSKLSDGERYDEWYRVKEGKARLIIGARSALFLPAKDLGIIILDEEHENTYKSEQNPKYHTREVAEFISKIKGCKVILGSATPSIETYYRALSGEIELIELKNRVYNKAMPKMEIIDMREELKSGNISMFSRKLMKEIRDTLSKKEQVILFLNRRGFSTFVSCRSCGYVFKCPHCDISLTYHKNGLLNCHYCGYSTRQEKLCPKCKSKYVKYFGAGTERVEEEIKKYFSSVKVLRMDIDTTRNKNSYEYIYDAFKKGEADILIGTQMISKGLDFQNVTLVGVLAADMSLNIPDYRSSEKTYQLITQVSGRAGRGDKEGKVIVQTYNPEHYSIEYAKKYDYEGFYKEEFTMRGLMNYPPFAKILLVNVSSKNERLLIDFMRKLEAEFPKIIGNYLNIEMLGPVPCIISKIKENYRWQILLKGDLSLEFCNKIKDRVYQLNKNVYNDIKISLDINPNSLS
ncbi:primosomal protein N' [Caproiciproducens sp. MSJ-32]|uniref:primosomal protein N' n=1 Tax=Caproiciproducens sp. MSJ-32 TaxID=2841527 RepID=UPI001C100853|nr:primosomal protein N' [Caproiciproducens sp. MSJ-32]MBU5454016.1 primosomal protein N' [Caproiciproducens sp. MSJ-32]